MKCDIKTAPSPRAVFLSLHFAKGASRTGGYGVQAAQAKNFAKVD